MSGYVVAKANQTAMCFVAKAENERDGWIVIGRKAEVEHFAHVCAGDGRVHHHGMVHTILRGSTNDLANVGVECGCAERDRQAWNKPRNERGAL